MTPITCAKPSPPKGRAPSFPTTRHARSNIRSTSISMPSAISWNAASPGSSNSAASQPALKRPPEITVPSSLSQQSSYGCDKCPHHLGVIAYKVARYIPTVRWVSMVAYVVVVTAIAVHLPEYLAKNRFVFLFTLAAFLPMIFDLTKDWKADRFL